MKATRDEVYDALDGERAYQESRWQGEEHELGSYILYMEDYMAELKHLIARNAWERVQDKAMGIMRKVTALGVASMEQHGVPPRE